MGDIHKLQPQITKLQEYVKWAHMDLNLAKCAITSSPNKFKLKPNVYKTCIPTTTSPTKVIVSVV